MAYRKKMTISKTRGNLYLVAKILGDLNAVLKGKVGSRLFNRLLGRSLGKLFIRR
jgi:hypothetical protein